MSEKQYKTEWSFSFENIGKKFSEAMESIGADVEVQTASFTEPLDDAKSARVELDLSIGKTTISALDGASDNLFEADVRHVGELDYHVSGTADKQVFLGQKKGANAFFDSFKQALSKLGKREQEGLNLVWDIRLNPNVPLDLSIDGGMGLNKLDLSGVTLKRLEIDGGVGETHLTLPQSADGYTVDNDGGVGETTITVPENTSVKLTIDGGVGQTRIKLAEGTAARVISDGGIGDVKVPKNFKNIEKRGDFMGRSGTWETEGYSLSSNQVEITIDGGIGSTVISFYSDASISPDAIPSDAPDAPQIV
ncbi:MAG: hypothetical protein RLP44_20555 [Aggregatilineales bacterium]